MNTELLPVLFLNRTNAESLKKVYVPDIGCDFRPGCFCIVICQEEG